MSRRKVALYIRKSREDAVMSDKEETLQTQEQTLIRLAESRGYKQYDIFKEIESSIRYDRPELIKLMRGIEQGMYSKLLIIHIDRLGRDVGLLDDLKKLCIANDVIIETPDSTINFKDDNHDLMYGFSSVLADFEYKRIRHRLATGKINTVAIRNRWIGSQAPYGYYYCKEEKILKPHPEQSVVFRNMVAMALEGSTFSEIANKLNDLGQFTQHGNRWTAGRIQKLLKNRTYLGEAEYNSTRLNQRAVAKNCHEPLMSYEEYDTIHKLSASRRNYDSRDWGNIKTPLDNLVYCGKCHRKMSIQISKKYSKKRGHWHFYQARRCIHYNPDGTRCTNSGCKIDIIEAVVLEQLEQYKSSLIEKLKSIRENDTSGAEADIRKRLEQLKEDAKKQDVRLKRLTDLYLDAMMDKEEYEQRRKDILEESKAISSEIGYLEAKLVNLDVSNLETKYQKMIDLIDNYKDMPLEEKNKMMRLLIARIELTKENTYSQPKIDIWFMDAV
ncbi:recombinase family protein [Anoxybacillus gonensis]|uniref:recombinase family protein n=1 Tax=Anoxybacillus gonensis TaxID=198467 RepID=UPI0002C0308F|nr:recombinase family protein [Anoxybacillus gonensis]EMI11505.1 recombinase family [Anoxybacillus gonensis]